MCPEDPRQNTDRVLTENPGPPHSPPPPPRATCCCGQLSAHDCQGLQHSSYLATFGPHKVFHAFPWKVNHMSCTSAFAERSATLQQRNKGLAAQRWGFKAGRNKGARPGPGIDNTLRSRDGQVTTAVDRRWTTANCRPFGRHEPDFNRQRRGGGAGNKHLSTSPGPPGGFAGLPFSWVLGLGQNVLTSASTRSRTFHPAFR